MLCVVTSPFMILIVIFFGGLFVAICLTFCILLMSSVGCRFVLSLENDLTVRAKTTEVTISDFSSGSYSTIFREEVTIDITSPLSPFS